MYHPTKLLIVHHDLSFHWVCSARLLILKIIMDAWSNYVFSDSFSDLLNLRTLGWYTLSFVSAVVINQVSMAFVFWIQCTVEVCCQTGRHRGHVEVELHMICWINLTKVRQDFTLFGHVDDRGGEDAHSRVMALISNQTWQTVGENPFVPFEVMCTWWGFLLCYWINISSLIVEI